MVWVQNVWPILVSLTPATNKKFSSDLHEVHGFLVNPLNSMYLFCQHKFIYKLLSTNRFTLSTHVVSLEQNESSEATIFPANF